MEEEQQRRFVGRDRYRVGRAEKSGGLPATNNAWDFDSSRTTRPLLRELYTERQLRIREEGREAPLL